MLQRMKGLFEGIGYLVSGIWYQVSSIKYQVSSIKYQVSSIKYYSLGRYSRPRPPIIKSPNYQINLPHLQIFKFSNLQISSTFTKSSTLPLPTNSHSDL